MCSLCPDNFALVKTGREGGREREGGRGGREGGKKEVRGLQVCRRLSHTSATVPVVDMSAVHLHE